MQHSHQILYVSCLKSYYTEQSTTCAPFNGPPLQILEMSIPCWTKSEKGNAENIPNTPTKCIVFTYGKYKENIENNKNKYSIKYIFKFLKTRNDFKKCDQITVLKSKKHFLKIAIFHIFLLYWFLTGISLFK